MSISIIGHNTGDQYTGVDETSLKQGTATTNYQSATSFFVSKFATSDHIDTLLKVTGLTNIPSTDTVTDAVLWYYVTNGLAPNPITVTLRRLLRNANYATATWNTYDGSNNWTSGGGRGNGTDRSSTVSAAVSVALAGGYYSFTSAQLIADVQDMVANPGTNYGWQNERTDSLDDNGYREFISTEGSDTGRPYLVVTHTAAPTPAKLVIRKA